MELKEKELEEILGGAPKETVNDFLKPGELDENNLDNVIAGLKTRDLAVEKNIENKELFRESSVNAELNSMLNEQDIKKTNEEIYHKK